MDYLHTFTVTVLLVAFLCFFCEALSPEGIMGKYVSLVTGLVVSLALVSAFLQIRQTDLSALVIPTHQAEVQSNEDEFVTAQFAERLATAVEESVLSEFGTEITVKAEVTCKDKVLRVEKLHVANTQMDATVLSTYIKTYFGVVPEMEEG